MFRAMRRKRKAGTSFPQTQESVTRFGRLYIRRGVSEHQLVFEGPYVSHG